MKINFIDADLMGRSVWLPYKDETTEGTFEADSSANDVITGVRDYCRNVLFEDNL